MFRKIVAWLVAPLTRSIITAMKNDVAFLSDVSGALSDHMCRSTIVEMVVDNLNVSAMDIANSLDMHDVAAHIDIDSLEDEIASKVTVDADAIADKIEISDVAEHLDTSTIEVDYNALGENVCQQFSAADIAEHVDYYSLSHEIEARDIADHFDTSDIAEYVDTADVARELDLTDVADHITWNGDDYEKLAKALLKQFVEATQATDSTT